MPSFLVHGLIPPLVLIASRAFETRKVLWLLPVTFLPDADFFFGIHRATTGNLFLPMAVGVAAYVAHRRPDWRRLAQWLAIAAVYLVGHALMDTFAGGIVPFYPLWDRTFLVDVSIFVDTATVTPIYTFEAATHAGAPVVSPIYEFLSGSEFSMLAFGGFWWVGLPLYRRFRGRPE